MAISKITNTGIDNITIDSGGSVGIGTTTNNQSSSTASVTLNAASGMSAYELRNADVFSGYVGNTGTNMYLVNAKNGSLGLYTNNTERMQIDSSGRVTMPYQPAFYVYNLNFPDSNSAGTASGGSVLVNIGSHYATGSGRFTAPISGTYMFTMMTQAYDSGNTTGQYQTAVFRKNGSNVGGEAYHGWQPNDGNNHVQAQNTIIISLSANDYMQAYVQYGSRDIQNFFSGYLIG